MITGMPRIAIAVDDFSPVVSTFKEKLGMPVIDISAGSVDSLGAKLAMCVPRGGSNIEIMSPGNPDMPLSQSIRRFLDRRGEGHFALMLEAADPDGEAEALLERGLNVLPKMEGAGGRDVHPNSTHGVLIRVYPINSYIGDDPNYEEGPDAPGLTGIGRVIIAVRDLDQAIATFGEKFAMDISEPAFDAERGVHCALCTPPSGGVIELVASGKADTDFARSIESFLAARGEGMFALILGSNDLQQTRKALGARGLGVSEVPGLTSVLEIDLDAMFGTRFWIEQSD